MKSKARWILISIGYVALAFATFAIDHQADAQLRNRGCVSGSVTKEVVFAISAPIAVPVLGVLYAMGRAYPPDCPVGKQAQMDHKESVH